jgi:hypothetical protein
VLEIAKELAAQAHPDVTAITKARITHHFTLGWVADPKKAIHPADLAGMILKAAGSQRLVKALGCTEPSMRFVARISPAWRIVHSVAISKARALLPRTQKNECVKIETSSEA